MLACGIVLVCALIPLLLVPNLSGQGQRRDVHIRAQQYTYTPHRIVVDQGDEIHLRLASKDVVHGFYLEGHDIEAVIYPGRLKFNLRHPSIDERYSPTEEITFIAARPGKFRYRCSVTCGTLHPFMLGEMIVRPNYAFLSGSGATVGLFLAAFIVMFRIARQPGPEKAPPPLSAWRVDLLKKVPGLNWMVRRRWLQFAIMLPMLAFFLLFMIAGFFGSPIGNRNIIITFVWILWWFLLIAVMLPFGSRIWCLLCPFPFFGEWFQRKRLLGPAGGSARDQLLRGLKKKWPQKFSNIWLQNVLFLALCTFSAILVTRPVTTAAALGGLAVLATIMHMIYPKRTFCTYVCPVSGFLGLYSMTSMIEVRARDLDVCKSCRAKGGMVGSKAGWGCPWFLNPSTLDRNNYCGFCMECIKTCSHENMTLRARPFCSDLDITRYDEAWKAFIMIALAMVYSLTLLGPWGTIKAWANISEVGDWQGFLIYAGTIWSTCLVGLPVVWVLTAWLGKQLSGSDQVSTKEIFLRYSYLLVPLGLLAWVAFSIPLIMINGSYIISSVSDPMGWGWDLFGTADFPWTPLLPEYVVFFQIPLLLTGLGFSLKSGYHIAATMYSDTIPAVRSLIPAGLVCTGITMALIRLFAG